MTTRTSSREQVFLRQLHLWELRDWPLIEQWKSERRGDRPT